MKFKLWVAGIVLIVLLVVASCTAKPATKSVQVSIDDLTSQNNITRDVEIAAGSTLLVSLGSNPSTGFSWSEQAQIGDTAIVRQDKHEFVATNANGVVGAPGTEEWTFTALKKGTTTVSMDYSRPWAGGEKGVWTFKLNVTVK